MVEGGGRVFWAVQGVLVGGLALLAGITLQRELAMHKLHREVGELKGLLVAFSGREITFDEKVFPILKFAMLFFHTMIFFQGSREGKTTNRFGEQA